MPTMLMRLVLIETVDFRKSEANNFAIAIKRNKLDLGPYDVVALLSSHRDQLCFVFRPTITVNARNTRTVIRSLRLRMQGGAWEPLRLQDYANEVGIELRGIRRFEDIVRRIRGEVVRKPVKLKAVA